MRAGSQRRARLLRPRMLAARQLGRAGGSASTAAGEADASVCAAHDRRCRELTTAIAAIATQRRTPSPAARAAIAARDARRSSVEHRDGAGLIARAGRQEAAKLLAAPDPAPRRAARASSALRASLRGDDGGQIGELLRLQARGAGCRPASPASAPVADWLDVTSADICVRLVSRLPTTPA